MVSSKKNRYSQPIHISRILDELTGKKSKALFSYEDAKIFEIWAQIVDEEISSNARPISFKNGELVLLVTDPIWRNELNFLKTNIIASLNKALGKKKVRNIELTFYDNN